MVVKIYPSGMKVHEPPFTKAEEDEFYRRVNNKKSAKKGSDKTRP
jgi:hypothetical protein